MRPLLSLALLTPIFFSCLIQADSAEKESALSTAPMVYRYDMTYLFSLDLQNETQRRRFFDETHLITSLQGLVNRDSARLYVRYLPQFDDFWWNRMREEGAWLEDRSVMEIASLEELLNTFRDSYEGAVVWDERVPSTSNLASTIAGVENLLCLRFDESEGSLYRQLTIDEKAFPVVRKLMREDGSLLFTGTGIIPDTNEVPSTQSAKCDAYVWLIENYVKPGKVNPNRMGYYLDGFWLQCWNAGSPQNHTLTNHDYVIAQGGVLFDLNVWEDESTVDDPDQPTGTDVATLKRLLRAMYDRFEGDGVIHVAGFVPWAYKYTNFQGHHWNAGGKHEPVPSEWRYAEIISCFNGYMDADAIGLCAMANASFYQHHPLPEFIPQNPKPTVESLKAAGILDASGHAAPKYYYAHYVGDYDAAAWMYQNLPRFWEDPARGSIPISWAFNPNLCERFPLGMLWTRENRTENDFFIAGDCGAGYLNVGYLCEPRPHSGLPSGLAAWERHCTEFFTRWDISLTGFLLDGYARGLSPDGFDAYARFSPDGIVGQKVPELSVHNEMPILRMGFDLPHDVEAAAQMIVTRFHGAGPRFSVCRSILQSPTWYARVDARVRELAGDSIEIVDMYTLLWLIREYVQNPDAYKPPPSQWAGAREIHVTPDRSEGLYAIHFPDGPFNEVEHEGTLAWRILQHYLYFGIIHDYYQQGDGPLEVSVRYLDEGVGQFMVQYDSTDGSAPLQGTYKDAIPVSRTFSGEWKTAVFHLPDPLLASRQNGGADFRIYNPGDLLLVSEVVVRKRDGAGLGAY